MSYLNVQQLEAIVPAEFNAREPFPWCNPAEILTPAGFDALTAKMPVIRNPAIRRKAAVARHDLNGLVRRRFA